jgi:hypothetical protein
MPNPNAAPRMPGNMTMRLEPGNAVVEIDGYRLEQFITGISLAFSVRTRRPVLTIDLEPSTVDVTAPAVEIRGDFRDFLVAHGWRPPE